jgi:hypothetical protein
VGQHLWVNHHYEIPEMPTSRESFSQCRACGRRRPLRISAAYDRETESAVAIADVFKNHLILERQKRKILIVWIQSVAGACEEGFSEPFETSRQSTFKKHVAPANTQDCCFTGLPK